LQKLIDVIDVRLTRNISCCYRSGCSH